jgi:flagella basal body P-ring formation protein FlgA
MVLESKYYCDEDIVTAEDLFPEIDKNFVVAEFQNRTHLQLSARKLKELFAQHGYTLTLSHPVVALSKSSSFDKAPLKEALAEHFIKHYGRLEIRKITLRPRTHFEQNGLSLHALVLPSPNLTRPKGTFHALYADEGGAQIKVYFSYKIDAHIAVLKAKRNIANGTILCDKNTYADTIPLTNMNALPIGTKHLEKSGVKGYVKQDTVITTAMIREIPDVLKNQRISAVLKANGVNVTIYATAQEEGRIGQTIRVKSSTGESYNARITDKNKAVIE